MFSLTDYHLLFLTLFLDSLDVIDLQPDSRFHILIGFFSPRNIYTPFPGCISHKGWLRVYLLMFYSSLNLSPEETAPSAQ